MSVEQFAAVDSCRLDRGEHCQANDPRLLVSVRTAREASAALAGGADIVDVKEPSRGPLGMADAEVIAEVLRVVAGRAPVSAALGEVRDWLHTRGATGSACALPRLPQSLSFAKLGLARMRTNTDWVEQWQAVRRAFETAAGAPLSWVAVGYADHDAAGAPPVDEIIDAAAQTGCCGMLIDTCNKSSGSLLQLQTPAKVQSWQWLARENGLFFAVAGKLNLHDLQSSVIVSADVVGVRSAACRGGDRREEVASSLVLELKQAIQANQLADRGRFSAARN